MKTIYRYEISFRDEFTIFMPKGAELLYVARHERTHTPCVWAIVDTNNEDEVRRFTLVGTGTPIDEKTYKHIGSFQYQRGDFVGHLFEIL